MSGDGHADVLATKPDGTLWYYPNNMDSNPNHVPFVDGTNIGRDWAQFDRVMSADVSGDGHADVLATNPTAPCGTTRTTWTPTQGTCHSPTAPTSAATGHSSTES
ncbi:hypothetical protein GCM10027614_25150 [Micromonospora vulcania]